LTSGRKQLIFALLQNNEQQNANNLLKQNEKFTYLFFSPFGNCKQYRPDASRLKIQVNKQRDGTTAAKKSVVQEQTGVKHNQKTLD
jgi:hypothetical protein